MFGLPMIVLGMLILLVLIVLILLYGICSVGPDRSIRPDPDDIRPDVRSGKARADEHSWAEQKAQDYHKVI